VARRHLHSFPTRRSSDLYFSIFPWSQLPSNAVGFDLGCGSGRWAKLVAPKVGTLHLIDPSSALTVAKRNLLQMNNCVFHQSGVRSEEHTSELQSRENLVC